MLNVHSKVLSSAVKSFCSLYGFNPGLRCHCLCWRGYTDAMGHGQTADWYGKCIQVRPSNPVAPRWSGIHSGSDDQR